MTSAAAAIPKTQQAAVLENPGPDARIYVRSDIPVETPGPDQILVKLSHNGICGSEVRAFVGWGAYNQVIGHEGVGTVVSHGADVPSSILGKRVGIKWLYQSCRQCSACTQGFQHNCPKQMNTGRSCPGTLQQYVIADPRYVTEIPDGLPGELAAPLLCAGLTMIGAVDELSTLKRGNWVVISGSGGGLGHIGVQIAARMRGYRVIGVDTGASKRQVTLDSGADAFVDYKEEDVEARVKSLTGGEGAHATIVVPSSEEAFRQAPLLVRNRGIIAFVGLPADDIVVPVPIMTVIRKALTIKGVLVGSEAQMVELLEQAALGVIKPHVQVVGLSAAAETVDKLTRGEVSGRVTVAIPQ